jgi:hypothetical protein
VLVLCIPAAGTMHHVNHPPQRMFKENEKILSEN